MHSSRFARLARTLVLLSSLCWAVPARAEDPKATNLVESARTHYAAGVAAYSAGRFREAVDEFIAADRLATRPALSYNIARAYDRLGDAARALQYYREYLRRDAAPANAAETRSRVRELEAALAQKGVQQLSVRSEPSGAILRIDDRLVGTTPWTGELPPGSHRLTITLRGYGEHGRAFELLAAHATDIDVRLETRVAPAPRVPSSSAAVPVASTAAPVASTALPVEGEAATQDARFGFWPWVALGAGGAALVGGLGFELARRSAEDDTEDASHAAYFDSYDRMEARKNTARVLVGVGSALAITGGVLLYFDQRSKNSAALTCGPELCGGRLEGRF
jgi:tetratricopeptide (TPR) repeat protein